MGGHNRLRLGRAPCSLADERLPDAAAAHATQADRDTLNNQRSQPVVPADHNREAQEAMGTNEAGSQVRGQTASRVNGIDITQRDEKNRTPYYMRSPILITILTGVALSLQRGASAQSEAQPQLDQTTRLAPVAVTEKGADGEENRIGPNEQPEMDYAAPFQHDAHLRPAAVAARIRAMVEGEISSGRQGQSSLPI